MKKNILAFLSFVALNYPVLAADVVSQQRLPDGSRTLSIKYNDLQDGTYAPMVVGVDAAAARVSYRATSAAFTPGVTPADVFTITGSATKTVKVYQMCLSSVQSTAGVNAWYIAKRSTANSGGTSTNIVEVPVDSNSAAASATVLNYTNNATSGTIVANIWGNHINSPAAGTAGIGNMIGTCVDFTSLYGQPVTLRGTGEVLGWNFNLAALPSGLSVIANVSWTEE